MRRYLWLCVFAIIVQALPANALASTSTSKLTTAQYANQYSSTKSKTTFSQVCKLIKKAAYAHNEFRNDDYKDDFYDRWYGRIRSYYKQAAKAMRSLKGNYSDLIADAQYAGRVARGVNAGLTEAEENLYSACDISEDAVYNNFEKWMG